MAKLKLENFIQSYLKNVVPSKIKNGYEAWLRQNGTDGKSELSEAIGKLLAESEKNSSDYSAIAETISGAGMKNSGYSKYLAESALISDKKSLENLLSSYVALDSKNASGYEKEIKRIEEERVAEEKKAAELQAKEEAKKEAERIKKEKEAIKQAEKLAEQAKKEKEENQKAYEKAMNKIYKEVEAEFKASGIVDYDKAYAYARNAGLSEEDAKRLAKTYTDSSRNSKINKVTSAIISKKLTRNQAKEYALVLGLSQEDADVLAEFAFKTNESVSDIVSDDYLNNLK